MIRTFIFYIALFVLFLMSCGNVKNNTSKIEYQETLKIISEILDSCDIKISFIQEELFINKRIFPKCYDTSSISVPPPPPDPNVATYYFEFFEMMVESNLLTIDEANVLYESIDSTKTGNLNPEDFVLPVLKKHFVDSVFSIYETDNAYEYFNKLFGSPCFVSVSNPVFNDTYDKALVCINEMCGGTFGQGLTYFLVKKDGYWQIKACWGRWVS